MINSKMSVGELAAQIPESTRLFETLRIDYSCGSGKSLVDACYVANVQVDDVVAMLNVFDATKHLVPDLVDFQNLSLTDLITHILRTHHVFTKSEIERLETLSEKVLRTHGENHLEVLRVVQLVHKLCDELKPHLYREEMILFPYIQAMEFAVRNKHPKPPAPFGTVESPIQMLTHDHEGAGDILRELRLVTSEYKLPADACVNYKALYQALEELEKDLHQHTHLENNILFPKATELACSWD